MLIQVVEPRPLMKFLEETLKDQSRTAIKQMLKHRSVYVNGKPQGPFDYPLKPGDKIEIQFHRSAEERLEPRFGVKIIDIDEHIVVIQKPAKLLTIATDRILDKNALTSINEYLNRLESLRQARGRTDRARLVRRKQVFIVHRLDRDASGLLLLARTEQAKFYLQDHWHQFTKKYYAVVEGKPEKPAGRIESYLHENKILRVESSYDPEEGKLAVTHYRMVRSNGHYSLLEVVLGTGRKHQIRIHMAQMRCPIVGDKEYGSQSNPAGRLGLHAFHLSFRHPVTKAAKTYEIPLPEEFKKLLGPSA